MFHFAQTNLQLLSQMQDAGYAAAEVDRVRAAYAAVLPLFAAHFRGSGKPFLAHLVGTASILATRPAPVSEVIAGLLHAVHMAGDFGFGYGAGYTTKKHQWVIAAVGDEAATIVQHYHQIAWQPEAIAQHRAQWHTLTSVQRSAITVRLANLLDDFSDAGMLQGLGKKNRKYLSSTLQQNILALCTLAQWTDLKTRLEHEFQALGSAAQTLAPASDPGFSKVQLPPSATLKLLPRGERLLMRGFTAVQRRIHR
ncbi:MAG: HD domain-containing protein [Gammaproteobacteria bacterium]|nr:HD domain-containing protein [Gammaproteobacteria bacterium]